MIHYVPRGKKNFKTKETLFYAEIAPVTPLSLEDLSDAITEVCTVTRHDIVAVLSALQEQIIRAILNGQSVRLGDLGSFRPTLSGTSAPTDKELTEAHIRRVNCRFTPGRLLRHGLSLHNSAVRFSRRPRVKAIQPPPESSDGGGGGGL